MTEEKQLILNMLKEGKITVEEASDLLAAIGDKNQRKQTLQVRLHQQLTLLSKRQLKLFLQSTLTKLLISIISILRGK